jgi:hypothetical protein
MASQLVHEPCILTGTIHVLLQYDVSEEIRLDRMRELLSAPTLQQPAFKHPAPGYIRFERPPVVEPSEPLVLDTGEKLQGIIKYYDYGVVSVLLQLPFSGSWEDLIALTSRWGWDIDFPTQVSEIVRRRLKVAAPALVKPHTSADWLSEDYLIIHIRHLTGTPTAGELTSAHGPRIAQVVRGDTQTLSIHECQEILQSSISYYPTDISIIGWNAAFLYDTPTGAEAAIQLLEYANSQLLEFRHYDGVLTQVLASVYDSFEQRPGFFARWQRANSANRLHTVLLDVMELTEHADNAIKFLSDMFAARLYRLAAAKVGVPDYKNLVNQKINTAEDLYRFMVDQFNQSRAFFLESAVVIILVIELLYLFRDKGFFGAH